MVKMIDTLISYKVDCSYEEWRERAPEDVWDYPMDEYDHCLENNIRVDIYVFNDCVRLLEKEG